MYTPIRSICLALGALTLTYTAAFSPLGVLAAHGAPIWQQQPPPAAPPAQPAPDQIVTPGEIQRMFEAVALVRSQETLKLTDEKYLPFLAKYKALQDARRHAQQDRNRTLNDLRKLANDPAGDEAQIKERLKALMDLQTRGDAEIRKAQEGVDSVLDARQQVKFRLFEDAMEVQKVELITKARQANRQQQQQKKNP
jgi:hypothetical protein